MGDTFSQTGGGSGNQFQQGHGNSQVQHNSAPTAKSIFEPIKEELKESTWDDHPGPEPVPPPIMMTYQNPIDLVEKVESLAENDTGADEQKTIVEQIKWALPMVGKTALVGVKAAASALVKTSPVVAATIAMVDVVLESTDES
jgi:hypothetical protein